MIKEIQDSVDGGIVQTYGIPATGGPGAPVYASVPNNNFQTGRGFTGITVSNSTEGSSGTNANLPPYLGIRFIIKT